MHKGLSFLFSEIVGCGPRVFYPDGKHRGPSNSTHKYKKYHCCGYDKRYCKAGGKKTYGDRKRHGTTGRSAGDLSGIIFFQQSHFHFLNQNQVERIIKYTFIYPLLQVFFGKNFAERIFFCRKNIFFTTAVL